MFGAAILFLCFLAAITVLGMMALGFTYSGYRPLWHLAVAAFPSFAVGVVYATWLTFASRRVGIGIITFFYLNLIVGMLVYVKLIRASKRSTPNQSTDPTSASGTPGAGHQPRHP
jgi:hypothetical protein